MIADEHTLEIAQMLVLSTCHIAEATADLLPILDGPVRAAAPTWWPAFTRHEGWLFHVIPEPIWFEDKYGDAPKDLRDVIAYAKAHGCTWLMFDRDGPIVEGLYQYDW